MQYESYQQCQSDMVLFDSKKSRDKTDVVFLLVNSFIIGKQIYRLPTLTTSKGQYRSHVDHTVSAGQPGGPSNLNNTEISANVPFIPLSAFIRVL